MACAVVQSRPAVTTSRREAHLSFEAIFEGSRSCFIDFRSSQLALAAASVTAVELPVYHVAGLPITPLQLAVIGSAGAEQAGSPVTLTLAGMPASPHQIHTRSQR
jgi:hypothetical protein